MIKRMLRLIIVAYLFIVFAQQTSIAEEWPLPILWPPGNFATQGAMEFSKLVKEKSGGKLTITVHPGGALGYKGPEMLRVIKDGLVPIGEMLLGFVAGSEPILDLSTNPFLVADYKEAKLLGTISRPTMEKVFNKWNQRLVYWHFWPGAGIYAKKPINSIEDMKDLKIRTFNVQSTEWVKAVGAKPISMPWGDVYMALFTGAVDAVLTSTISGVDGKFWEVTPYFTDLGFTFGYSAVTVNLNSFNKLTEDLRNVLIEVGRIMDVKQEEKAISSDRTAREELTKRGVKIIEMSPTFRKQCVKLSEGIWSDWVKKSGPEGEHLLNEIKKATQK